MRGIWRRTSGAVFTVVLLGVVVWGFPVTKVLAEEAAQRKPAPQERMAVACRTAELAFEAGDVAGGCSGLLDALRSLDVSRVESIDLTTKPLHLLSFAMCALMDQSALSEFLTQTLNPSTHPIDDVVTLSFQIMYRGYAAGRAVPPMPLPELVQLALRMSESPHCTIRAGGLMALAWYIPDGSVSETNRTALNRLAQLCPNAGVTREILHRLLIVAFCSGQENELIARSDWAPAVQTLIANDPIVDFLNETESVSIAPADTTQESVASAPVRSSPLAPILEAAQEHPDPKVRDWCMRRLEHAATHESGGESTMPAAVVSGCRRVAFLESEKTLAVPNGTTPQGSEMLRAQRILLMQAIQAGDANTSRACVDALWATVLEEEPFDTNSYEAPVYAAIDCGLALMQWGDYTGAVPLFERVAQKYPNSAVGLRCLSYVEHITKVQKLVQP